VPKSRPGRTARTIGSALAKRIKLVGFDVDGVFTDGGIYIGLVAGNPLEFKRFHVLDGLGVKLLRTVGLPVVLLSGRESEASEARAKEMDVDELLQVAPQKKLAAFMEAVERRQIALADSAYVGDDLADLPVLRAVGLPIAVANAIAEVKAAARYVTSASGGQGAVREVAEQLIKARGEWTGLLAQYFETQHVAGRIRRSG
jgi:3-deoxy-D-manno-octulosonate 8-phosphate phosphatase (KDO 8-P phosphatase)